MSKMGSHCSFGHLKHKLWPKERSRVELQFDSRPQKVENRPDLLSCKGCATYRWKAIDESYNFTLDRTEDFSQSYGVPKSRESHLAQFRDSHAGVPGKIAIWM
jgi:hypothetical protein